MEVSTAHAVSMQPWDKDSTMDQHKYRDAIDQVHSFNSKLLLDRRLRMPYIDSQTGIAHQDCHLWVSRVQRCPPLHDGQVYSYPARRWRCVKRPDFTGINKQAGRVKSKDGLDKDEDVHDGSANPGDPGESVVTGDMPDVAVPSFSDSGADGGELASTDNSYLSAPVASGLVVASSKSFETFDDYYEDFESDDDSGEEYGSRKKKRKSAKPKSKKNALAIKLATSMRPLTKEEVTLMSPEDRKKPYDCQICGKRYKNMQGLRYHYEHYNHDTGEESSAVIMPESTTDSADMDQPLNKHVSGAKRKKGSPPSTYCDFCLGDTETNKKSGSSEQLISCFDCGRSGHPFCLQFSQTLVEQVQRYRWQCIECKCCCLCGTSDNDDQLLFCDECDRGYHMYCLKPPIDEPPEGSWHCQLCAARTRGEDLRSVAVLAQHMDFDRQAESSKAISALPVVACAGSSSS